MTPERERQLRKAAANRQFDLAVILENVHDPHNLSAVVRTCDSVGIGEVYVLYTDPRLQNKKMMVGKKSSSGARKWVSVIRYHDVDTCIRDVKSKYQRIFGTHIGPKVKNACYDMDFVGPCALAFGNEHRGLSKEVIQNCDQLFMIPQVGLVQSLNISVACAIALYETFRQRITEGKYHRAKDDPLTTKAYQEYVDRMKSGESGRLIEPRF